MELGIKDMIINWIDNNLWFFAAVIIFAFVLYIVLRFAGVIRGNGRTGGGGGDGYYNNSPGAAYRNGPPTTRANSSNISVTRK